MLNRILPHSHRFQCPDEHHLAAYVDQELIGAERERVESHLAKCDSCLQQVGFLIKQSQTTAEFVPSSLVSRAKQLQTASQQKARFGWNWVSAVAAGAAVAMGLLVWREARPNIEQRPTIIATAQQASARAVGDDANSTVDKAVRSAQPSISKPRVLYPQPGATIGASDLPIRWEPVPNAAAYEVRVVTAEGDLVWRKRVHENLVNPHKQILRPGVKYFIWVRAWLANGKTQQSEAVGFTVR